MRASGYFKIKVPLIGTLLSILILLTLLSPNQMNSVIAAASSVSDIVILPRGSAETYLFEWGSSGQGIWVNNTVSCSANPDFTKVIYWRTSDTNSLAGVKDWNPNVLVAGNYDVYAYIPDYTHSANITTQAKYYYNNGDSGGDELLATLDQNLNKCQWVLLGRRWFDAGTGETVYMRAQTNDNPYRLIAGDGLKLVYVEPAPDTTPPDGTITSPANAAVFVQPGSINISANASDNVGGSGVQFVKYFAQYDGTWHILGSDPTAPYEITWQIPAGFTSQQIKLAIRVTDNAGNEAIDPGGYRLITYQNAPSGDERSVPSGNRFYLNQRSLSDGSRKCGVSSIAMVLASNGSISGDYNSMKNMANQMWANENVKAPSLVMVVNAFRQRGYTSNAYYAGNPNIWSILKQEIAAGRPVIVNSPPGYMTPDGHYIVAMGYKDSSDPNQRLIYAYDPFGRHKDCYPSSSPACNTPDKRWVYNSTESSSTVGKWAAYPWGKLHGQIVTAQRNSILDSMESFDITDVIFEPELISDEPSGPSGEDPSGGGLDILFLPLLIK